jgi:hypothetical protein
MLTLSRKGHFSRSFTFSAKTPYIQFRMNFHISKLSLLASVASTSSLTGRNLAPNNSFKPTPCRGVGHVLYATLAHVRRPATGRLNSGVRRLKMAYYKDFTPCTYFQESDWLCRLMAIGWLEGGKPFLKGRTDSLAIERIHVLRGEFRTAFPSIVFRGLHACSLCCVGNAGGATLDQSHINLFIPHRGFVFVAPARVDHYIQEHGYLPPESFVEALLACPSPLSPEYRSAIQASNRGVDAPLFRDRPTASGGA